MFSYTEFLPSFSYNNTFLNLNNILIISNNYIKNYLIFLKLHTYCQFKILSDLFLVDLLQKKNRFLISYNLLSLVFNTRLTVLSFFNEFSIIYSISKIYRSSLWFEREIFDLFGIFFYKHPSLKRILTDYGYMQNPLKKDFPLMGFFDIYYNDKIKLLVYKNVELSQNFKINSIQNIWSNNE